MQAPFDPHPNWRKNFAFTSSYPSQEPTYVLDPVIELAKDESTARFTLDPIIHKFSNVHVPTQAN